MKKLKLHLEELVVDSFAIDAEGSGRGTVQAHNTCADTCVELDCSGQCTGSCGTDPGSAYCGTGTVCGPTESHADFSCSTGGYGCQTMYEWTGCDWSCCFGPCNEP